MHRQSTGATTRSACARHGPRRALSCRGRHSPVAMARCHRWRPNERVGALPLRNAGRAATTLPFDATGLMLIHPWMLTLLLQLAMLTLAVVERVRANLGMTPKPPTEIASTATASYAYERVEADRVVGYSPEPASGEARRTPGGAGQSRGLTAPADRPSTRLSRAGTGSGRGGGTAGLARTRSHRVARGSRPRRRVAGSRRR
jgi:hypothetical protein